MIKITGSVTHPAAASVTLPNAYIEVGNVNIREGAAAQLIWSAHIWADVADKAAGAPSISSDNGVMTYDPSQTIDDQLQPAMISNTAGGAVDYSNCAAV